MKLNEGATLGLSSIRTAIQAYLLKQNFSTPGLSLRWVNGSWNIADALTKESPESRKSFIEYLKKQTWCLKYDPNFISARKSKAQHSAEVPENLGASLMYNQFGCLHDIYDIEPHVRSFIIAEAD